MGELSKRQTSDLHPNESGEKKKKDVSAPNSGPWQTSFHCFRIWRQTVLQPPYEGELRKSHFKIFESLLVTLVFLVDLKDSDEHLSVFCFKLGEHKFSVLRSEKTIVVTPAPSFCAWWFLLEGFLSRYSAMWFNSSVLPATSMQFSSVHS